MRGEEPQRPKAARRICGVTMTTLEEAKKLLGETRIPDAPEVLHEFLTLLEGVINAHSEDGCDSTPLCS